MCNAIYSTSPIQIFTVGFESAECHQYITIYSGLPSEYDILPADWPPIYLQKSVSSNLDVSCALWHLQWRPSTINNVVSAYVAIAPIDIICSSISCWNWSLVKPWNVYTANVILFCICSAIFTWCDEWDYKQVEDSHEQSVYAAIETCPALSSSVLFTFTACVF